jgi:hypothetical protein
LLTFKLTHYCLLAALDIATVPCYRSSHSQFIGRESVRDMKTYHGMRTEAGCTVVVEEDGELTTIHLLLNLRTHSPTGVEWGYGGSGPSQLALALAADALGDDDKAQEVYQRLKFKLVGGLPHEG